MEHIPIGLVCKLLVFRYTWGTERRRNGHAILRWCIARKRWGKYGITHLEMSMEPWFFLETARCYNFLASETMFDMENGGIFVCFQVFSEKIMAFI